MQKNKYSSIEKFSRLFNEILIRYQNFSGWQGKEHEFVGRRKHPEK
jgi:hypothetical protein